MNPNHLNWDPLGEQTLEEARSPDGQRSSNQRLPQPAMYGPGMPMQRATTDSSIEAMPANVSYWPANPPPPIPPYQPPSSTYPAEFSLPGGTRQIQRLSTSSVFPFDVPASFRLPSQAAWPVDGMSRGLNPLSLDSSRQEFRGYARRDNMPTSGTGDERLLSTSGMNEVSDINPPIARKNEMVIDSAGDELVHSTPSTDLAESYSPIVSVADAGNQQIHVAARNSPRQAQYEDTVVPRSIRSPTHLDPLVPRSTGLVGPLSVAPASTSARERLVYGCKISSASTIGTSFRKPFLSVIYTPPTSGAEATKFDDAPQSQKVVTKALKKRKRDNGGDKKISNPAKRGVNRKSNHPKIPNVPVIETTSTKDIELASRVLEGKTELINILSERECSILGEHFWVFTVEQLDCLLPQRADRKPADYNTTTRVTRDKFRLRLALSPLVAAPNRIAPSVTGKNDVVPKTAEPSIDDVEIHTDETKISKIIQSGTIERTSTNRLHSSSPVDEGTDQTGTNTLPANADGSISNVAESQGSPEEQNERRTTEINTASVSQENLLKADILLESWMGKVDHSLETSESAERDVSTCFLFDGPIGLLLPPHFLLFLKSLSIFTLFDFLGVRKTESSPFIAALYIWRRYCNLPEMKLFNLSRYVAGISLRLETALRLPPVDGDTRLWIGSAFAVLTGTSKEFILDECGCFDPKIFVDSQTKSWSSRLVEWRKKKGMAELKGSGKVAMISGWKTAVRESLDFEKEIGLVVSEADLMKVASENLDAYGVEIDASSQKSPSRSRAQVISSSAADDALMESADFLSSVLKQENTAFLASIGIQNVRQLMECNKAPSSPFILALVKFRSDERKAPIPVSSCIRLAYEWIAKLKRKAEETTLSQDAPKDTTRPRRKVRSPVRTTEIDQIVLEQDPICALSVSARQFLETAGVKTAETFLASRTTDLARRLVRWRVQMDMAELKGGGESATISGWKASVRRRANQMGLEDVASILPQDQPVLSSHRRIARESKPPTSLAFPPIDQSVISHPGVLFGCPRQRFSVRNRNDRRQVYHFELSVRMSSLSPSEKGLFLCYEGASSVADVAQADESQALPTRLMYDVDCNSPLLPVLEPVSQDIQHEGQHINKPFASDKSGCGLIEIGQYGGTPPRKIGVIEELNPRIRQFVFSLEDKSSAEAEHEHHRKNIVHAMCGPAWTQCLVRVQNDIEAGQVVEIAFDTSNLNANRLRSVYPASATSMAELAHQIQTLSKKELAGVLSNASRLAADVGLKMMDPCEDDEESTVSIQERKLALTVARRRIHWVGTQLWTQLHKLNDIMKTDESSMETLEEIRRLFIVPELSRHYLSTPGTLHGMSAQSLFMTEVFHEIETEMILQDPASSYPSLQCPFSSQFLRTCTDLASNYLLRVAASATARRNLQDELLAAVSAAVTAVASSEKLELGQFASAYSEPFGKKQCRGKQKTDFWTSVGLLDPTTCATLASVEAYRDAMALVGEPDFAETVEWSLSQTDFLSDSGVVCVQVPWGSPLAVARSLDETIESRLELYSGWYIENCVLPIVSAVAASVHNLGGHFELGDIAEETYRERYCAMYIAAKRTCSTSDTNYVCKHITSYFSLWPQHTTPLDSHAYPSSLPLFLALVWPRLRSSHGWRMKSGDTPDEVFFLPPQPKNKRGRHAGHQQSRQRTKIARRLMEVGLGNVSKLSQRLFIASAKTGNSFSSNELLGSDTIANFIAHLADCMNDTTGENVLERLEHLGKALQKCFEDMKGSLLYVRGDDGSELSDVVESDANGYGYLMRMLLVLPTILRQSGLPTLQINETLSVAKELSQFLATNQKGLFDQSKEVYEPQGNAPSYIVTRLRIIPPEEQSSDTSRTLDAVAIENEAVTGDSVHIREVVLPLDIPDLTEYASTVLRQTLACRATVADVTRKERKHVTVGYPGLMCRHCAGNGTEGRYFFSNVGSLGTASGVIFDHLMRCSHVTMPLKTTIETLKKRHSNDLKKIRFGAQAEYFKRLWSRLFSMNATIDSTDLLVLAPDSHARVAAEDDCGSIPQVLVGKSSGDHFPMEFKSHIELAEYLQTVSPWKDKSDLRNCFDLYYSCLEYGGKLVGTSAMPKHFSSEWLLDKLVPHRLTLKRTFKVG